MLSVLKASLGVGCGLGALATGLLYSFYREWIKSDLLNHLPPELLYKSYIYSLGATVFCFIVLIVAHVGSKSSGVTATADNGGTAVNSTGKGSVNVTVNRPK